MEMEKKDEIKIPWGTGIVGYVAESGEPVNIPDAYKVLKSINDCRKTLFFFSLHSYSLVKYQNSINSKLISRH